MERDEEMDEGGFEAEDGIRGAGEDSLSKGHDEDSGTQGGHKKSPGNSRLWIILIAFFALVCLVLAAVGLYTVKTRRAAEAAEVALAQNPVGSQDNASDPSTRLQGNGRFSLGL